jgi:hypothetical protein
MAMRVKELIAELQKFDGDLEVITEGCDCDGDVGSVQLIPAEIGRLGENKGKVLTSEKVELKRSRE